MNTNKLVIAGIVVALVLGIASVLGFRFNVSGSAGTVAGALNNQYIEQYVPAIRYNGGYNSQLPIKTTGGVTIGSTGTPENNSAWGTCYVKAYATTIAASSSASVDCQATAAVDASPNRIGTPLAGVQPNDSVIAIFSTTTAGTAGIGSGIEVLGASASSTAGYITLLVGNGTGATYTWPTNLNATGTVQYQSLR